MIERLAGLARRARRVGPRAAPARRRRLARAAHAGHEPAHQHRGAARRRPALRDDRQRLLADVVEQSEELSALVGDLIELARGDLPITAAEDVRLDRVVEESPHARAPRRPRGAVRELARARRRRRRPRAARRAVNNLLDNAAHHSAAGGLVEVIVDQRGVRVRDHGTGIDPADLPYVFDRFFRGANSRGRQGSGLGLAIVRQVAEQHGGSVEAVNAPDGGAVFTLRLPTVAEDSSTTPTTATRSQATRCRCIKARPARGRAAPAEPGDVPGRRRQTLGVPGARPPRWPPQGRLEPSRVVIDGVAKRLGQRLLAAPQRDRRGVGIAGGRPLRALDRSADRIQEGGVTGLDPLDVDPDRAVVPGDRREWVAVGPRHELGARRFRLAARPFAKPGFIDATGARVEHRTAGFTPPRPARRASAFPPEAARPASRPSGRPPSSRR